MKKPFLLAALDLDGTLFNSQSSVSEKNKEAIKAASKAGITFVIATGRPYSGLPLDIMKELDIRYSINTNGASLYKVPQKECLMEHCMPWQQTAALLEELLPLPIHIDVFLDGNAYTPEVCKEVVAHMDHLPEKLKEYILSTRTLIPDITEFLRREKKNVQKVTMNFPRGENDTILYRREAMAILDRYPDVCYLSGGYGNLEFTKKGISKAKGLAFLCDYLKIPQEQTLACGDSENDLDILKAAGLGIAMANAPEHVKEQAGDIAPSNDDDGVAAIIERWLL